MSGNEIVTSPFSLNITGLVDKLTGASPGTEGFFSFVLTVWEIYSIVAFVVSAIFIVGIVYAYLRFNQLTEIEVNQLLEAQKLWQQKYGSGSEGGEWATIIGHLESENPNDWKLAIIEADIALERILEDAGFAGNTVGEKLKSASPSNFTTLQDAWDAHTIRNKIAHQGEDFVLTKRIAQEALTKFRRVFDEFGAM